MKRFLLFVGDFYYPLKGLEDLKGDFDTLEETKNKLNTIKDGDWFRIYDGKALIEEMKRE